MHLLDLFPTDGSDPAENYRKIRRELEAFSPKLAEKHEIIAANKMDLATDEGAALKKLRRDLSGKEVLAISARAHKGLDDLMERIWRVLAEQREEEPFAVRVPAEK